MRVLVADDDRRVRLALRLFLEERGLDVVGEAQSAEEVEPLLQSLRPDVLVLDWELAGLAASRALADLPSIPGLHVIALSNSPDGACAGSAGVEFVCKTDPPDRLTAALSAASLSVIPAGQSEAPGSPGSATWR